MVTIAFIDDDAEHYARYLEPATLMMRDHAADEIEVQHYLSLREAMQAVRGPAIAFIDITAVCPLALADATAARYISGYLNKFPGTAVTLTSLVSDALKADVVADVQQLAPDANVSYVPAAEWMSFFFPDWFRHACERAGVALVPLAEAQAREDARG